LIGVLGVYTRTHVNFDSFVELRELDLLEERNGLIEG